MHHERTSMRREEKGRRRGGEGEEKGRRRGGEGEEEKEKQERERGQQ